jgi:uncharacterized protein (TIGR02599 family)
LLEVLVATAVLALLIVVLATATNSTVSVVGRAQAKINQFSAARAAFEQLTSSLGQATLNTRWTYDDPGTPSSYERYSDLHFLVAAGGTGGQKLFFQSPVASSTAGDPSADLLEAVGFWVAFGDDSAWRPSHVSTARSRYRLFQGTASGPSFNVFDNSTGAQWTSEVENVPQAAFPVAENVIALILHPRLPATTDPGGTTLTTDYLYDSRGAKAVQQAQLPPAVQVTLIVIDEASAQRMENGTSEPAVIQNALAGKFLQVSNFASDLQSVKTALDAARVNYLVLSAPVTLRESKWSLTP